MAPLQTSGRFCAPDADITILSSDGVLFKLHRKNLEVHSDIFANAANATDAENDGDKHVELSESAAVLDLLFQYMYRQPQPNLQLVEFPIFAGLAEAVEKYVVYSALPATMGKMKEYVSKHPLHVLDYAAKHDHKELANEAARLSIGLPMSQAMAALATDTFIKWTYFYDQWHENARKTIRYILIVSNATLNDSSPAVMCAGDPTLWYKYRNDLNLVDRRPRHVLAQFDTPKADLNFLDTEFMPMK